jgi:hypothetical protein
MGRRSQDVKKVFTSLVEQTNKQVLEINEKTNFLWYHESLTVKINM